MGILKSIQRNHFEYKEKRGWKTSKTLIGSNIEIYNFLVEHDYDKK